MLADTSESDSRSRLIAAATNLVHAGSYQAVGVQAICDEAQVKKGSFYHFFDSKQALILAALDEMWDRFKSESLEPCFDAALSPQQRVEAVFALAARTHREIRRRTGRVLGCPFGNLAAEASTLEEPIRDRVLQIFAEWAAMLETTINEALDKRQLPPAVSAATMAWTLLSTLQGALLMAKVANDPRCIEMIGSESVARLLPGAAA